MKTHAKVDFDRVPAGEPVTVRVMVSLEPEPLPDAARTPLNLAVVIDRSGSMAGGKLESVKEAVRTLFGSLDPADTVSLVAFDNNISPLLPPVMVAELEGRAPAGFDALSPGGNTNLCGGYEQGGAFAARKLSPRRLTRVLLLTDGQANAGIVRPAGIGEVVDRFRSQGITTSTIGVGADYNEELLGLMAERGGGATYFLSHAAEASAVFAEELGDLLTVDAGDVTVRFVPALDGLRVEQLNTYAVADDGIWRLGDLFGSRARHLVLEIAADALAAGEDGRAVIGHVQVSWRKATGAGFESDSCTLPVTVGLAPREELVNVSPDREVTLQAAFLVASRAQAGAIELADQGSFDKAAALLEACAAQLDGLGLDDEALAGRVGDLRGRADRLRHERERFYDARQRKLMYTEREYMAKGRFDKMSSMHARQGMGQDASVTYPCYNINGHILVEVDQDRVLIDTGSPHSVGNRPAFAFMGSEHRLQPSFQGTTVDQVGDLVGTRITVLMGADILSRYDMRLHLEGGTVTFTTDSLPIGRRAAHLDFFTGVPIVEVEVGGRPRRLFFDTGAKLSYLHSSLTADLPKVGREQDFFPGFGEFEVELVEQRVALCEQAFPLRFGSLPMLLETALLLAGVEGILGSAVFEGARVTYAPRRKLLAIE
jgi:Ca-activated chloride channel family protein